jgi:hypothetical protein
MVFDRAVAGASSAYTITVGDGRLGLVFATRLDGTTEVRKVGGQFKAADVEVGDTLVSMSGQPALVDTALTRVIFAECAAPVLIMSQQAVSLEMVMQLRAQLVAIKQDHDSELDAVIETTQNKHRTEIQTQTTLLSTTLQDLRAQADGETCQICSWKFPAASNSGVSRIAFLQSTPEAIRASLPAWQYPGIAEMSLPELQSTLVEKCWGQPPNTAVPTDPDSADWATLFCTGPDQLGRMAVRPCDICKLLVCEDCSPRDQCASDECTPGADTCCTGCWDTKFQDDGGKCKCDGCTGIGGAGFVDGCRDEYCVSCASNSPADGNGLQDRWVHGGQFLGFPQ